MITEADFPWRVAVTYEELCRGVHSRICRLQLLKQAIRNTASNAEKHLGVPTLAINLKISWGSL